MQEHQIEPELLRSPRLVRRRGTHGLGAVLCFYLMALPLLLFTALLMLDTAHKTIVRVKGPTVPGRISDARIETSDEGKPIHHIAYHFQFDGQEYSKEEVVERELYEASPIGGAAKVQVSPLWASNGAFLLGPGRDVWGDVWFNGGMSLAMLVFSGWLTWYLAILPNKGRGLVRKGVPVCGRLTAKIENVHGVESSQMILHYFDYEYQPAGASAPLTGRQKVQESEWGEPAVGECFTVLHDPQKPQISTLYRFSDFEALADGRTQR